MIKTRYWMIGILTVLLFSLLAALNTANADCEAELAEVYLDGRLIKTIELSLVDEPYELTISGQCGDNIIAVERGRLRVVRAECPDKLCVEQGWCSSSAPIVCLPNRLVIQLVGEGELDGVAQ